MPGGRLDTRYRVLQVIERTPATGTRDIFRLGRPQTGSLEDAECGGVYIAMLQRTIII